MSIQNLVGELVFVVEMRLLVTRSGSALIEGNLRFDLCCGLCCYVSSSELVKRSRESSSEERRSHDV